MKDGIEVDFLPVGEHKRSGDAIVIRWRENDEYKVMVYDGGTKEYGKEIVAHIQKYYGVDHIDYVVNSHPDNDHAGGLAYVLENMSVGELWMHRPWTHSAEIRDFFHDGRITDNSLAERLQDKMSAAYALEKIAEEKDIPIIEPFADCQIGIFKVLSPLRARYTTELIPEFEKSPEQKKSNVVSEGMESLNDTIKSLAASFLDKWDFEYLPETVKTSAENESSAILFAKLDGKGFLLTGDAGIKSLREAAVFAQGSGINLPQEVSFVQIPHHGGRHNVSTETLDLIIGKPLSSRGENATRSAYASAGKEAPTHPKKVVTNAFVRRGFKVAKTKGQSIRYQHNMEKRAGWVSLEYVPFYDDPTEAEA